MLIKFLQYSKDTTTDNLFSNSLNWSTPNIVQRIVKQLLSYGEVELLPQKLLLRIFHRLRP